MRRADGSRTRASVEPGGRTGDRACAGKSAACRFPKSSGTCDCGQDHCDA
jgi:hypothetical protein